MALFMGANEQMASQLLASLSHIFAAAVILRMNEDEETIYKGHEKFQEEKERRMMGR
jgi:hypothetical protein